MRKLVEKHACRQTERLTGEQADRQTDRNK